MPSSPYYSDDHVKQMYLFFLDLYQRRYVIAADCECGLTAPCVTWAHFSYWRKSLNHFGGIMVERNMLQPEDYVLNKQQIKVLRSNGQEVDVDAIREQIAYHPNELKK